MHLPLPRIKPTDCCVELTTSLWEKVCSIDCNRFSAFVKQCFKRTLYVAK